MLGVGRSRRHSRVAVRLVMSSGGVGVDDFGVVDSAEVHRGDPEVRVLAELALDDDQGYALSRYRDRVG